MSDKIIVDRKMVEDWSTAIAMVVLDLCAERPISADHQQPLIKAMTEMKRLRRDQAIERG